MKNINEPDYQRLTITIFLVAIVLVGWQMLVEWPRRQHLAQAVAERTQKQEVIKEKKAEEFADSGLYADLNPNLTREERLALSKRLPITSNKLHGSIALKGARFDDLTLAKYKVSLEKDSPDVTLLNPNGDKEAYFAHAGWVAVDGTTKVPDDKSEWKADKAALTPDSSVTLSWDNGGGVAFFLTIALDKDYMFTINQRVENHSGHEITVAPFAYINRAHEESKQANVIMHEGPLGTMQGSITELNYKDLREKGNKTYDEAKGWIGITDKYWLTALIPGAEQFKGEFSHYNKNGQDRYQTDYVGGSEKIAPGAAQESKLRLFAGAKEINVLDSYAEGKGTDSPPIPLFDRAVDFGVLYFLTKPMFLMLNFFFTHIGNFGLAIMLVTIVVKIGMYPLANKSYKAMTKMRILQPEIVKLKEKYHDDPLAMQKETMKLYKLHRINPASGCLPLLIQMPVFFALYKVLYVTIEMRHAPFFGWLKDLSAPDPSNIFTVFGLIPWNTPHFLHLGILPILYCISMIIQQKQQPAPTDPVQAKMIKLMPFFLLFLFATFPAGLVLYWVWSNTLSIIQQEIITLRHGTHRSQRAAANAKGS
jgi:YidC/Oxa1 family membrane protein insertase